MGGLEAHGPRLCVTSGELVVLLLLAPVVILSVLLRRVLGLLLFLLWPSASATLNRRTLVTTLKGSTNKKLPDFALGLTGFFFFVVPLGLPLALFTGDAPSSSASFMSFVS